MAEAKSESKIRLKILVDVKSNKVVFAEAGKDFVDFIFSLMSIPLSSVTKLLSDKSGMVGCFGSLCKGIESLDAHYYESGRSKDSVLTPRSSVVVPALSLIDAPKTIILYRCPNNSHAQYVSDFRGVPCPAPSCRSYPYNNITAELLNYTIVKPTLGDYKTGASFVKDSVIYMVMDNLEVKPMSLTLIRSLVKDFDYMEEKDVQFGLQEGLKLLKASFESQTVLTTVFLGKKI